MVEAAARGAVTPVLAVILSECEGLTQHHGDER
jgi:hypothetical protein